MPSYVVVVDDTAALGLAYRASLVGMEVEPWLGKLLADMGNSVARPVVGEPAEREADLRVAIEGKRDSRGPR